MSYPQARCSSSPLWEGRALSGCRRSSERSRWGGAPTSSCWTSAARISRPRPRTRCRTSCTRPSRATCATSSWTVARWCSTATCSRCPSRRSCARPRAAAPSCGGHGARMSGAALATLLALQGPPGDSAALYASWCESCHGADGRGVPAASTRLEVPPADLRDCKASTAEPEERWIGIVTRGGAAFGLSRDMPAFGEAATPQQIRAVVRYARSLCGESGWPPGELNFPRPHLVEKAFPENEWVVTEAGRGQALIYERRFGKRLQVEGEVRTVFDSVDRPFDGVTAALKYNVWHSLERRALASLGVEATPPLGRHERWEIEPFLSFGAHPRGLVLQGEVVASWEEADGVTALSYRLGVGQEVGRVVPMLEAGWTVPREGEHALSLYPQLWVRLSRLGHVAASVGAELPAVGPAPRHPRLIAFVLWDYGDAPLMHGW